MDAEDKICLTFDQHCEIILNQKLILIVWPIMTFLRGCQDNMMWALHTSECVAMINVVDNVIWTLPVNALIKNVVKSDNHYFVSVTYQWMHWYEWMIYDMINEYYQWMHWYELRQCGRLSPSRCTLPGPAQPPGSRQTCPENIYFINLIINFLCDYNQFVIDYQNVNQQRFYVSWNLQSHSRSSYFW